jgi:hypothetical protein
VKSYTVVLDVFINLGSFFFRGLRLDGFGVWVQR